MRDLAPFVQFKKRAKPPLRSVTPPLAFFTFFELYKWYQLVQSITYYKRLTCTKISLNYLALSWRKSYQIETLYIIYQMGLYVIGTSIMKELIRLSALTPFFQQKKKIKNQKVGLLIKDFLKNYFRKKRSMIDSWQGKYTLRKKKFSEFFLSFFSS